MAYTTTRAERADRSRLMQAFLAAATVTTIGIASLSLPAVAQVKAPAKSHLKAAPKSATSAPSSTDNQADQLNAQWLQEHGSNGAPATAAPAATADAATVPVSATLPGAGARTLVNGSVKLVSAKAAAGFLPGGPNNSALQPLSDAFAGFGMAKPKLEIFEGRTADGATHLLYASIGDSKAKRSYWWFMPLDQPEGWFDENGKRLGGTMLSEPKPGARISSPFGTRHYYGRATGTGFHDGIDFESHMGEPIYAAADGVINHEGWYYQYGRTVKITHADNFETLYGHMSRFEPSVAVGSHVHKGDVIGYVGSTGRSTGPHLHFSVIINGKFVDPAPYVSAGGGHDSLTGQSLVAYRQWQQDVRTASDAQRPRRAFLWSENPFTGHN
ncbi:MAG TPA: M23 family metallopeptidase [Reyranella sp.]|jgi:murein DD-endopeptidase MepM/ murein hydrolase activator NlpD